MRDIFLVHSPKSTCDVDERRTNLLLCRVIGHEHVESVTVVLWHSDRAVTVSFLGVYLVLVAVVATVSRVFYQSRMIELTLDQIVVLESPAHLVMLAVLVMDHLDCLVIVHVDLRAEPLSEHLSSFSLGLGLGLGLGLCVSRNDHRY